MSSTRYKVEQLSEPDEHGRFDSRVYDSYVEQPTAAALAEYDVNLQKAGWIRQGGETLLIDGEIFVAEPLFVPPDPDEVAATEAASRLSTNDLVAWLMVWFPDLSESSAQRKAAQYKAQAGA